MTVVALIIVTGPPAAGKSTWVRQHARPGDIVIDYDLIIAALTAPGTETDTRAIKATAYRARGAAINEAITHAATTDVYVIHTLPSPDAMAKYREHTARVVTVDPGRDVVMTRIKEQRHPSMTAVAERWYSTGGHTQQQEPSTSRRW